MLFTQDGAKRCVALKLSWFSQVKIGYLFYLNVFIHLYAILNACTNNFWCILISFKTKCTDKLLAKFQYILWRMIHIFICLIINIHKIFENLLYFLDISSIQHVLKCFTSTKSSDIQQNVIQEL